MSRSNRERTSTKRSKMDRYTEDLKYSLRRRLSESVGRGSLRTDDILARSHRQIVADFTDPRQWYYSATHDYIIALMRESQKQSGVSVWGSGSRTRKKESSTSRGHSSPGTLTKEGPERRNKGSFIEIPTATSDDLQEIRGYSEARSDGDTLDNKINEIEKSGKGMNSSQALISKENASSGQNNEIAFQDYFVPSRVSPEGKSNISSKQDSTVSLRVNTDQDTRGSQDVSVSSQVCTDSDIPVVGGSSFGELSNHCHDSSFGSPSKLAADMVSTKEDRGDARIVEEYNVSAMEAYRESKQSQNSHVLSQKQKLSTAYADTQCYFPGKLESFVPVGKRSKGGGLKSAVSLPQIGKTFQTEEPESQRTDLFKVRRGRVRTRKRKLCPLRGLERISNESGNIPYVEDWIRKLQIDGKDLINDKHLKPIERVDETFHYKPQRRPQVVNSSLQQMDLPSNFKSVTGFQPFQPHPSLYLYSMKQKSDLNVKLQYLDIPRPVKQLTDPSIQQKHSFKDDLTQARSKVKYIESRLGELYKTETTLDRIVSRQQIKPLKKENDKFLDITTGLTSRISDQYSSQEHSVSNPGGRVPKDPGEKDNVNPPIADDGQCEMKTVCLALSTKEPLPFTKDGGPSTTKSKSPTQEDFHAISTSSWKEQHPASPGRKEDVRALEGKILRVFEEGSDGNGVGLEHQISKSLKINPEKAIASVHDWNAPDSAIDPDKHDHDRVEEEDEELAEEKTGSRLSVVVLEVLSDLIDRVESPKETREDRGLSKIFSGPGSTEDVPVPIEKDATTSDQSESHVGEDSIQKIMTLKRQCSFCDEPH